MPFFVGRFEYAMDSKGRVNVPAKFRDQLPPGDKQVVILRGLDGCLFVYPIGDVSELTDQFEQSQFLSDKEARLFQRMMFDGASTETPDAQGRITLNEAQRKHAGLGKKVVFLGTNRRMEIWDPERLQQNMASSDDSSLSFDAFAEKFFSGPRRGGADS